MKSTEIIEMAKQKDPSIEASAIHGALFRLKKAGQITAEGEAKNLIYSLK